MGRRKEATPATGKAGKDSRIHKIEPARHKNRRVNIEQGIEPAKKIGG
jgi:hypothetical protein